ncbi:MAG TPA: FG-GAP-like repeat-containing protein [Bacteroidia bacterium]|nr:FG-GAP-like repeat-containing protein [Bacteroidia bacterium]
MKIFTLCRLLLISMICVLYSVSSKAQFAFTNSNNLISATSHSGCSVTVADMNNDGLDDIVKMDQSTTLVIDIQNRNGTFAHYNLGNITGGSRVWGMAVADVDHNGWKDVATGVNGAMYLVTLSWAGTTIAKTTINLPGSYFVQNVTFGDFNYDGWVDLEVCDDDDYAKVYVNNSGTLAATTTLINTNINPGMFYGNDPYDSGNYGSVWTDFDNDGDLDLYIAHCRQSTTSSTDQRRRDRLFVNNGSNVYTEQAQAYGIEVTNFRQTWTTSFGDIENDGDLDIVMTNHGENGQVLQNDGTGHFTDITASTGFVTPGTDPLESFVEDFDNDGYIDILISGGGPFGSDSYFLYHNNGNSTFTLANTPIPSTTNGMLSFAGGDLNHDGKIDIFASYGDVYNMPTSTDDVLLLNTTDNANHFITFALTGTVSNHGAIGARATIYGAWGKQIREVRAGESYGTCNSFQLHFGLGAATVVDSAIITWPSGQTTTFNALGADQFVTVVEGGCSISNNIIGGGPYILCTGQTLTLTAPPGFATYSWSNGDLTQSTTVSSAGTYNVLVTSANGCSNLSPTVTVSLNPDETPDVTASGALEFCQGGSVTLTSSQASSYLWSNGATTQSISVNQSGTYSLTIQGVCGVFNSLPVNVNVLAAPLPVGTGASGIGPISLTLTATGNALSWYDQQFGGSLLGTGPSFNTPVLTTTTTYWVENATSYSGVSGYTGQTYHSGSLFSSGNNTNGTIDFDVTTASNLISVKVYTDTPGNREVQLLNSSGTVVQSLLVNIPVDSSRITLNFPLAPGTGYQLTTHDSVNLVTLGTITPRLQRSSQNVNYPYQFSNLLSITGSNQGAGYYYYFYDWEVEEAPTVCVSDRVPVDAVILPVGISSISGNSSGLNIYPNPANDFLYIKLPKSFSGSLQLSIADLTGRIVLERSFAGSSSDNLKVNLEDLAKGAYLVKVITEKDKVVQRIIVE